MLSEFETGLFVIVAIVQQANGTWEKGLLVYQPKEHKQTITGTFDVLVEVLDSHEDYNL